MLKQRTKKDRERNRLRKSPCDNWLLPINIYIFLMSNRFYTICVSSILTVVNKTVPQLLTPIIYNFILFTLITNTVYRTLRKLYNNNNCVLCHWKKVWLWVRTRVCAHVLLFPFRTKTNLTKNERLLKRSIPFNNIIISSFDNIGNQVHLVSFVSAQSKFPDF